jgi:hypothetical protein
MEDYIADSRKPRHEFFYDLIRDTYHALKRLKILHVQTNGIDALLRILKKNEIALAHGSLRFDRDKQGMVFMQEFRPGTGLIQRGYFHSIDTDRPLWEIVGTAIVRLAKRKERALQQASTELKSEDFCIILQGNLEMNFILELIKQGRVSYDTHQEHLIEEPIYHALAILSKLKPEQVIQMKLDASDDAESKINAGLFKFGKTVKDMACLFGKTEHGEYYSTLHTEETALPVHTFGHKVVPIEIARGLKNAARALLRGKQIMVLNNLTFAELSQCLVEREQFYYEVNRTASSRQ